LSSSNCVVNLTPDKRKVLEQVYEMLKVYKLLNTMIILNRNLTFVAWR